MIQLVNALCARSQCFAPTILSEFMAFNAVWSFFLLLSLERKLYN